MIVPAAQSLTESAWRVLECAREEAVRLRAGMVDTDHLLLALARLDQERAVRGWSALGLDRAGIATQVERFSVAAEGDLPRPLPFSAHATAVMEAAGRASQLMGSERIEAEHVLLGVLKIAGRAGEVIAKAGGVLAEARERVLDTLNVADSARPELGGVRVSKGETEARRRAVAEAREEMAGVKSRVEMVPTFPARELTRVSAAPALIGRDRELAKIEEVISRGDRSSLFVIGPAGSGKRALIRAHGARLVERAGAGLPLQQVYLFEPSLAREAAPPIFEGEGVVVGKWLSEILQRAETGIFAFSQFVSDEWVYDDLIEFIVPACLRRWAVCIFLVTLEERRALARRHPALTNVTFEIELPELAVEHVTQIVAREAKAWPVSEHIAMADTAIEALVNLARKFLPSRAMPGAAIEVLAKTHERVRRDYAPRLPEFEKSIDEVQKRIRNAVERGAFEEVANCRRDRDTLLREYDERIEKLQAERGVVVIGTGEVVKTIAGLSGKPEDEVRAGGVWK